MFVSFVRNMEFRSVLSFKIVGGNLHEWNYYFRDRNRHDCTCCYIIHYIDSVSEYSRQKNTGRTGEGI